MIVDAEAGAAAAAARRRHDRAFLLRRRGGLHPAAARDLARRRATRCRGRCSGASSRTRPRTACSASLFLDWALESMTEADRRHIAVAADRGIMAVRALWRGIEQRRRAGGYDESLGDALGLAALRTRTSSWPDALARDAGAQAAARTRHPDQLADLQQAYRRPRRCARPRPGSPSGRHGKTSPAARRTRASAAASAAAIRAQAPRVHGRRHARQAPHLGPLALRAAPGGVARVRHLARTARRRRRPRS